MTREEKEKYNRKIKLYERLGAEKFQKIVFAVEKLKFKIIKKCFPNFIKWFDKRCDKQQKKLLAKAKSESEKNEIKRNIKFQKMAIRKEMNQEKNRNYHMDSNRPTEIYKFLEFNKKIHINGLIKDAILTTISVIAVSCGLAWAIPFLVAGIISAGLNFECINIQNCSICKYKRCEDILKKKQEKKVEKNIEKYGEAAAIIEKAVEESETLPSLSEIIKQAKTKEELEQLKKLIQDTLQANKQRDEQNSKIRGNK